MSSDNFQFIFKWQLLGIDADLLIMWYLNARGKARRVAMKPIVERRRKMIEKLLEESN